MVEAEEGGVEGEVSGSIDNRYIHTLTVTGYGGGGGGYGGGGGGYGGGGYGSMLT